MADEPSGMTEADKHELWVSRQSEADKRRSMFLYLQRRDGQDPSEQQVTEAIIDRCRDEHFSYMALFRASAALKAQVGDFSELAELVRNDMPLNGAERRLVAARLMGETSVSIGAPKKHNLRLAIASAYFWRVEFDGCNRDAVIAECEAQFGRSRSTIERYLAESKDCPIAKDTIRHYRNLISVGHDDVINKYRCIDLNSE